MSIVSDPTVRPRPDDDPSSPATVDSAFTIAPEPSPRRLVVDAQDISLTFETADGKVDALSNVSLQIADGEFVSFIGPSGCGKTTILRVIERGSRNVFEWRRLHGAFRDRPDRFRKREISFAK